MKDDETVGRLYVDDCTGYIRVRYGCLYNNVKQLIDAGASADAKIAELEHELEIARALQPPPPEPEMTLGSAASHDVDHYYKECFGHWDGVRMCSCDEQQKTDCQRETITLAEACRIATEVTEDAERRRAETAEREAKAFHEQTPRQMIEQFLDYANLRGWNIRNFYGVCIKIDDLADLIEEFETQKEKEMTNGQKLNVLDDLPPSTRRRMIEDVVDRACRPGAGMPLPLSQFVDWIRGLYPELYTKEPP